VRGEQRQQGAERDELTVVGDRVVQHDPDRAVAADRGGQPLGQFVRGPPHTFAGTEPVHGDGHLGDPRVGQRGCRTVPRQHRESGVRECIGGDRGAPVPRRREDRGDQLAERVGEDRRATGDVGGLRLV
jgi:hypothetical protein